MCTYIKIGVSILQLSSKIVEFKKMCQNQNSRVQNFGKLNSNLHQRTIKKNLDSKARSEGSLKKEEELAGQVKEVKTTVNLALVDSTDSSANLRPT
jgi:hypothetical protein